VPIPAPPEDHTQQHIEVQLPASEKDAAPPNTHSGGPSPERHAIQTEHASATQRPSKESSGTSEPQARSTTPDPPLARPETAASPVQALGTETRPEAASPRMDNNQPALSPDPSLALQDMNTGQANSPGSPARNIQLHLNQGDQRIDVRVSEHG